MNKELAFQLQTLYTDKEIIDISVATILSELGYTGYIQFKHGLSQYTLAIKNLEDYAETYYKAKTKALINSGNFKSNRIKYL